MAALASALLIAAATVAACGSESADGPGSEGQPTERASATEKPCPAAARCFDFTEDAEGWPEASDDEHFAGRDAYLDGTYRVGARQPGSWNFAAPVRASRLDDNYGVQVDADATLGQAFPSEAAWGATCWTRKIGEDQIAGFAVYVQLNALTIGLYDEDTGDFEPLKELETEGLTRPGEKTHLMLRCRQDVSTGEVEAKIEVEVDGATSLTMNTADSAIDRHWQPADGLGVLVAGKDADVFFDHVVLNGA